MHNKIGTLEVCTLFRGGFFYHVLFGVSFIGRPTVSLSLLFLAFPPATTKEEPGTQQH